MVADLCEQEKIQGFPTLKLYIKGRYLSEYNGERSEEEFFKFIVNAPTEKEDL